jgi:hypothetical protein
MLALYDSMIICIFTVIDVTIGGIHARHRTLALYTQHQILVDHSKVLV